MKPIFKDMDMGGVTIPLFHCLFNQGGSVTHFLHDYEVEMYRELQNLYVVCVAERSRGVRRVIAGFFIKTSYRHDEPGFQEACKAAMQTMKAIPPILPKEFSLLPARLTFQGEEEVTEAEMLQLAFQQYLKFDESGRA